MILDDESHMRSRTWRLSIAHADATEPPAHGVPKRFKDRGVEGVLLEAISAAPAFDELLEQRVELEPYGTTERYVEILERDRVDMTELQGLKRRVRVGNSDSGEIPLDPLCGEPLG
jgi:hypothetical protein